jgi:hypothetical protein
MWVKPLIPFFLKRGTPLHRVSSCALQGIRDEERVGGKFPKSGILFIEERVGSKYPKNNSLSLGGERAG